MPNAAANETQITQHIAAPRPRVYAALLDPAAVQQWMVPDGMTSDIHTFDAREGGHIRVSLTYDAPGATGKTSAETDTYHGQFAELVPDKRVVQVLAFETDDPAMQGKMIITYTLTDAPNGGTTLHSHHDNLPPGIPPEDNATGTRISLGKLARLLEGE
ncbi:MAG: SRPBCC domain-containing protein [Thermomicrobiales bacterium]